jgi:hypothetical protein
MLIIAGSITTEDDFASDHMADFRRASASPTVAGMEIENYPISDVGPVR